MSGLGDGWERALVETETEGYVLANSLETRDNNLNFLIGGSTDSSEPDLIWTEYSLNSKSKPRI